MKYLALESTNQSKRPNSVSVLNYNESITNQSETQTLVSQVRNQLTNAVTDRENILAQLLESQKPKSNSQSELQACRDLRANAKNLSSQDVLNPDNLLALEQAYGKFVLDNSCREKPYLKSFVSSMDSQIQELNIKAIVGSAFTPKQIMGFQELANQSLEMTDIAGPQIMRSDFSLDNLDSQQLLKMKNMISKLKDGFVAQTLKLFPDLKPAFLKIDKQVSSGADPEKAKFDLSLPKSLLAISRDMTSISLAYTQGNQALAQKNIQAVKPLMIDFYDRLANVGADVKKRLVGATDAD